MEVKEKVGEVPFGIYGGLTRRTGRRNKRLKKDAVHDLHHVFLKKDADKAVSPFSSAFSCR